MEVYPSDYLVKVLNALKQLSQEKQQPVSNGSNEAATGNSPENGGSTVNGNTDGSDTTSAMPISQTRFFMSVKLDNTRVIRDLQKYLDEVISHLSATDNCDLNLTLEVSAIASEGFSQSTIRTITENCRTLRITDCGFD